MSPGALLIYFLQPLAVWDPVQCAHQVRGRLQTPTTKIRHHGVSASGQPTPTLVFKRWSGYFEGGRATFRDVIRLGLEAAGRLLFLPIQKCYYLHWLQTVWVRECLLFLFETPVASFEAILVNKIKGFATRIDRARALRAHKGGAASSLHLTSAGGSSPQRTFLACYARSNCCGLKESHLLFTTYVIFLG